MKYDKKSLNFMEMNLIDSVNDEDMADCINFILVLLLIH